MAIPTTTPWTEQERAFVLRALRRGVSRSKLAIRFGLTRNVVAGRIGRDPELKQARPRYPGKLAKKRTAMRVRDKEKKDLIERAVVPIAAAIITPLPARRASVPNVERTRSLMADMRADDPGLPPSLPEPAPEPLHRAAEWKPLVALASGDCRWPVVEDHTVTGHFLFCAAPVADGRSYCKRHHARVHSARMGGTS